MKRTRIFLVAILVFTLLMFSGCSTKDPIDDSNPDNNVNPVEDLDNNMDKTSDGAMTDGY